MWEPVFKTPPLPSFFQVSSSSHIINDYISWRFYWDWSTYMTHLFLRLVQWAPFQGVHRAGKGWRGEERNTEQLELNILQPSIPHTPHLCSQACRQSSNQVQVFVRVGYDKSISARVRVRVHMSKHVRMSERLDGTAQRRQILPHFIWGVSGKGTVQKNTQHLEVRDVEVQISTCLCVCLPCL